MNAPVTTHQVPDLPDVLFTGPPLEEGPLPAVLYLALSAEESLTLSPINHPVTFLPLDKVRVFSITLPGHGPGFENASAMTYWATRLASGENLFETFLSSAGAICQQLIDQGWITEGKFLAAGLSRGGFAAFHLLARFPYFSGVCAFAPVTSLLELPEFDGIPLAIEYGVEKFLPELTGKNIYISIGNRDTRVGTEASIRLALALVEENHAAGIRALPVELCLFPARGHRGHGTPPERFAAGARWMEKLLLT